MAVFQVEAPRVSDLRLPLPILLPILLRMVIRRRSLSARAVRANSELSDVTGAAPAPMRVRSASWRSFNGDHRNTSRWEPPGSRSLNSARKWLPKWARKANQARY